MQTSVVDLRYRMKDVLQALTRREKIRILYHGHVKGEIIPVGLQPLSPVKDHPFFGMSRGIVPSVEKTMKDLRKGRYSAL